MSSRTLQPADVLGFSRLAVEPTSGMVELVEALHSTIAANVLPGTPAQGLVAGTTAATYAAIRAINGLVSGGIDAALSPDGSATGGIRSTREREAVLAA